MSTDDVTRINIISTSEVSCALSLTEGVATYHFTRPTYSKFSFRRAVFCTATLLQAFTLSGRSCEFCTKIYVTSSVASQMCFWEQFYLSDGFHFSSFYSTDCRVDKIDAQNFSPLAELISILNLVKREYLATYIVRPVGTTRKFVLTFYWIATLLQRGAGGMNDFD